MAPKLRTKGAEKLKEEGNIYFQKCRYAAAIHAYTEAIVLCPNVPVYWTNRALCHRKQNDWMKVEEDCRRAIQLDHASVKGHYMLGLALLQTQQYAEGIKKLEKALELGTGGNPTSYIVEEIRKELSKAKYLEWEHESANRLWELQTLKECCELALKERYLREDNAFGKAEKEQLEALGKVFNGAAKVDMPTEVPDYLCCKITLELFRDPVISPSGVTYERDIILDHLQKVGMFDPMTREPLSEYQLVSNLAIKEAVEAFLDKHPWAYRFS
ncbi:E3 ubiquitin-protein ligase CHIP [Impatiens glandulifera]|uniref:E3 ubiquitin-protein ligase CHIP n=1 Tax=Impatiens glandulifera TaxID=253017 RepID=UPI001FB19179|nr:E3 ubiquitin-protein ligase CHIP [Impatiens glandulifera]